MQCLNMASCDTVCIQLLVVLSVRPVGSVSSRLNVTCQFGQDCLPSCPAGTFGRNCAERCSSGCENLTCDSLSGFCGRCKVGYKGDSCAETCLSGTYGWNCAFSCLDHCRTIDCDPVTGKCQHCEQRKNCMAVATTDANVVFTNSTKSNKILIISEGVRGSEVEKDLGDDDDSDTRHIDWNHIIMTFCLYFFTLIFICCVLLLIGYLLRKRLAKCFGKYIRESLINDDDNIHSLHRVIYRDPDKKTKANEGNSRNFKTFFKNNSISCFKDSTWTNITELNGDIESKYSLISELDYQLDTNTKSGPKDRKIINKNEDIYRDYLSQNTRIPKTFRLDSTIDSGPMNFSLKESNSDNIVSYGDGCSRINYDNKNIGRKNRCPDARIHLTTGPVISSFTIVQGIESSTHPHAKMIEPFITPNDNDIIIRETSINTRTSRTKDHRLETCIPNVKSPPQTEVLQTQIIGDDGTETKPSESSKPSNSQGIPETYLNEVYQDTTIPFEGQLSYKSKYRLETVRGTFFSIRKVSNLFSLLFETSKINTRGPNAEAEIFENMYQRYSTTGAGNREARFDDVDLECDTGGVDRVPVGQEERGIVYEKDLRQKSHCNKIGEMKPVTNMSGDILQQGLSARESTAEIYETKKETEQSNTPSFPRVKENIKPLSFGSVDGEKEMSSHGTLKSIEKKQESSREEARDTTVSMGTVSFRGVIDDTTYNVQDDRMSARRTEPQVHLERNGRLGFGVVSKWSGISSEPGTSKVATTDGKTSGTTGDQIDRSEDKEYVKVSAIDEIDRCTPEKKLFRVEKDVLSGDCANHSEKEGCGVLVEDLDNTVSNNYSKNEDKGVMGGQSIANEIPFAHGSTAIECELSGSRIFGEIQKAKSSKEIPNSESESPSSAHSHGRRDNLFSTGDDSTKCDTFHDMNEGMFLDDQISKAQSRVLACVQKDESGSTYSLQSNSLDRISFSSCGETDSWQDKRCSDDEQHEILGNLNIVQRKSNHRQPEGGEKLHFHSPHCARSYPTPSLLGTMLSDGECSQTSSKSRCSESQDEKGIKSSGNQNDTETTYSTRTDSMYTAECSSDNACCYKSIIDDKVDRYFTRNDYTANKYNEEPPSLREISGNSRDDIAPSIINEEGRFCLHKMYTESIKPMSMPEGWKGLGCDALVPLNGQTQRSALTPTDNCFTRQVGKESLCDNVRKKCTKQTLRVFEEDNKCVFSHDNKNGRSLRNLVKEQGPQTKLFGTTKHHRVSRRNNHFTTQDNSIMEIKREGIYSIVVKKKRKSRFPIMNNRLGYHNESNKTQEEYSYKHEQSITIPPTNDN